jgi:hypothetical protein
MTVLAEPILSLTVADQYAVAEPAEVRAFVAARPQLTGFLADAPEQITTFFPDAPLSLEVHVDPEDGRETLIVRVRTDLEAHEALSQLDRLTEAWYFDLPVSVQRDAIVTLGEL